MTLPSSGPISIGQIRTEMLSSSGSLHALSSLAGKSTPDSMSEFLGFSNGPKPPAFSAVYVDDTPDVHLTIASGGGATPQTYTLQWSGSADFSGPNTLESGVPAGSYTDNQQTRASISQTVYYRANALAQGKTSDWTTLSVVIPPTKGTV